jgi:hypothetical protein
VLGERIVAFASAISIASDDLSRGAVLARRAKVL